MKGVVYFLKHPGTGHVYIGTDSQTKRNGGRPETHARYGFTVGLAFVPGGFPEEKQIQGYFRDDRVAEVAGRSIFAGDRVYQYVTWLLERRFAAPSPDEAEKLGYVPYEAWGPRDDRVDEARAGQQTILTEIPPAERPMMVSEIAELNSAGDEWWTPGWIIELSREAMGSIDTDPASNFGAQQIVQAGVWYSKVQDGLRTDLPWTGNVWLNPPYGRGEGSAKSFIDRLVLEVGPGGRAVQAVTCLNIASTTAKWFVPVWRTAAVHLILSGRPNFIKGEHAGKNSPTKGTVLSYFGAREREFMDAFSGRGHFVRVAR